MNIFVVDKDPKKAAISLPDKLIVKMPLESAQMLATTFMESDFCSLLKKDSTPYKSTHAKHPCNLWLQKDIANICWLIVHAEELCQEYTRRYRKIHACASAIQQAKDFIEKSLGIDVYLRSLSHTPFVVAAPEQFKSMSDPVEAYRQYMHTKTYAEWRYTTKPDWWKFV